MIVVMTKNATKEQTRHVVEYIASRGLTVDVFTSDNHMMLGVVEDVIPLQGLPIESLPGVERIIPITKPFKLASRDFQPRNTTVAVRGTEVGSTQIVIIGQVNIREDAIQMREFASRLKDIGISILKAQPSVPTNGFSEPELQSLLHMTSRTGLPIMAEITSITQAHQLDPYVDLFLIGSHNMDNHSLLENAGRLTKPIILERSMSTTVNDWLVCAHIIILAGNRNVVLCDRGLRTFQVYPALDVNDLASVKALSHLPLIVDAGQVTGDRESLVSVCRASVAGGADGLVVPILDETEIQTKTALTRDQFVVLAGSIRKVAKAVDREFDRS